jgi:DNA transposition AAA+ family ATPase
MTDQIKKHIEREVKTRGVAAVARDLGLSRAAVTGYLSGACRDGTRYQVEAKAQERGWTR